MDGNSMSCNYREHRIRKKRNRWNQVRMFRFLNEISPCSNNALHRAFLWLASEEKPKFSTLGKGLTFNRGIF